MSCQMDQCFLAEARQIAYVALVFAVYLVTKLVAERTAASFRAAFHFQGKHTLFNFNVAKGKIASLQIQQLAYHHRKHLEMQATALPNLDIIHFPGMFLLGLC